MSAPFSSTALCWANWGPHLLLTYLALQSLHHFHSSPLDVLHEGYVFFVLWCPELHSVIKVRTHQHSIKQNKKSSKQMLSLETVFECYLNASTSPDNKHGVGHAPWAVRNSPRCGKPQPVCFFQVSCLKAGAWGSAALLLFSGPAASRPAASEKHWGERQEKQAWGNCSLSEMPEDWNVCSTVHELWWGGVAARHSNWRGSEITNHVYQCHIFTVLEHLQRWWLAGCRQWEALEAMQVSPTVPVLLCNQSRISQSQMPQTQIILLFTNTSGHSVVAGDYVHQRMSIRAHAQPICSGAIPSSSSVAAKRGGKIISFLIIRRMNVFLPMYYNQCFLLC